jgi:metallo-beta-lactamase class B
MKWSMKFAVIMVFSCFTATLHAQDCKRPLTITRLTGDFYVYTTCNLYGGESYPSNSMYLVTDSGVVMIDTPWDTTQLQPLLDSIQFKHKKKVVLSISTHYHADRTAGLDFFKGKGIRTYSSYYTMQLCREHDEEQAGYFFMKDTVFTVGQYRFETYHGGGGHTPDNIVVWFGSEKILYGGCLIKSTEATDLGNIADARLAEWPVTIRKIKKRYRKPRFVIPGHLAWDDNKSLEHTLQLLRMHEKQ